MKSFILALLLVLFKNCPNSQDEKQQIIGKWKIEKLTNSQNVRPMIKLDISKIVIEVRENGTLLYKDKESEVLKKWKYLSSDEIVVFDSIPATGTILNISNLVNDRLIIMFKTLPHEKSSALLIRENF